VNHTIEQVGSIFNGLSNVLQCLSHGDFSQHVQTDSQGVYQDIAIAENTGIAAMSTSITEVNKVIEQMTEGEFDQLKRHMNHSLQSLEQAIGEILHVS